MITSAVKGILNFRPNITFVAPRSGLTIPDPERVTTPEEKKETRVANLIKSLQGVAAQAEIIENLVADRVKGEVLKLNLSNPEDAVTAQAAARIFPDLAQDKDGFIHVPEITFGMYNHCIQHMKKIGKAAGEKHLLKQEGEFKTDKVDFGGLGDAARADKRPDVNQSNIPFAPLDIAAFIAAGIPILFGMLFPLINLAIKKDIVLHTHPVIPAAPGIPVPSGPGIPLSP